MSYEGRWKVLADMITWLRSKGTPIPQNVLKDLRSAKTMIQVLKVDPTHTENIQKIEEYLLSVESKLILIAQEQFGKKFAEEWIKKLQEPGEKGNEEERGKLEVSIFIPRLPKGEHWVRVHVSEDISQEDIEKSAKRNKLSHKTQKDGIILVYGDKKRVKSFVKEMTKKQRKTR